MYFKWSGNTIKVVFEYGKITFNSNFNRRMHLQNFTFSQIPKSDDNVVIAEEIRSVLFYKFIVIRNTVNTNFVIL